jgi:hypothetical protein
LRQVALVACELKPVAERLQLELGLPEPYRDPGIDAFGLENAVFAVGDTFLEVVAPIREGTTAGRYLDKRGADGGYMAIFQFADLAPARARLDDLGVRVVWKADHPDIAGTHLHPKDVPGAIVSLDWAEPAEAWRWAGPAWTGGAPDHEPGGITGITVAVDEPGSAAARWAAVLGVESTGTTVSLRRQTLVFTSAGAAGKGEAITEIEIAGTAPTTETFEIGGVRIRRHAAKETL